MTARIPVHQGLQQPLRQPLDYRAWQLQHVEVPSRTLLVATKPGVFAHGHADAASTMLASAMQGVRGQVVLSLACGNGVVGAAAARAGASQVWMTDRHGLACEAAQRTLAANHCADVTVLLGQGIMPLPATLTASPFADVVTVRVVPEKIALHQLLHDAMRALKPGGRCYVAGANSEGAKSAAHILEQYCGVVRLEAQREGHRMVSGRRPLIVPPVPDASVVRWLEPTTFHAIEVDAGGLHFRCATRPGVFSWEHLDDATADLLAVLATSPRLNGRARVLDLGCGAGVLGCYAALRDRTNIVTMVDEDSEAIRCVGETLRTLPGGDARALVSDVAGAVLNERFDVVLTNPPFHVGKQTNLDVPRQFIRDAHAVLQPDGELLLVANRTLPYEAVVQEQFGHVETRHDGRYFKVLSAIRSA